MRRLALEGARVTPQQAARLAKRGLVVLTERGKPVTALVGVGDDLALEALALSQNKAFMAYLDACAGRVSAGGGTPIDEVRKELGLPRRRRARASGATGPGTTRSR